MSEISVANCMFWILVLCGSMLCGCYIQSKNHAQYDLFGSGMYSREEINMFLVGQVSGLVENFNIGIFSDTINVINVQLCIMVLL